MCPAMNENLVTHTTSTTTCHMWPHTASHLWWAIPRSSFHHAITGMQTFQLEAHVAYHGGTLWDQEMLIHLDITTHT